MKFSPSWAQGWQARHRRPHFSSAPSASGARVEPPRAGRGSARHFKAETPPLSDYRTADIHRVVDAKTLTTFSHHFLHWLKNKTHQRPSSTSSFLSLFLIYNWCWSMWTATDRLIAVCLSVYTQTEGGKSHVNSKVLRQKKKVSTSLVNRQS